ncbi:MAG: hypothetical protein M0R17_06080 [Candidatus Omnitrophica bacterium]|jgi:hypothetical protein|nr:hypothetical protein [Candidatus Omnitrophota bacterium]
MDSKTNLRSGMMARVQRRADKDYENKCNEWVSMKSVSNGEKTMARVEVGSQVNNFPVRKITKFFTRG